MLDIILRPQTLGTYDVQAYRSEQLEPFVALYEPRDTHGVYDVFLQPKRTVSRSYSFDAEYATFNVNAQNITFTITEAPQQEASGGVWPVWWNDEPLQHYAVSVGGSSVRVNAQSALLWVKRKPIQPIIEPVVEVPELQTFDLFADGASVQARGGNVAFHRLSKLSFTRHFDIAVDQADITVTLGTIATSASRVLTVSGNALTITTGGGRAMLTTVTPITRKTASRSRQRPTMQIDSDLDELLYADTV